MLDSLIKQLGQDLDMDNSIQTTSEGKYTLSFEDDVKIETEKLDEIYILKSIIGPCPQKNKEAFLTRIMEANLFGRGTRSNVIGLTIDEAFITLTAELSKSSHYKEFKEKLEDFVTIVDFWRNEALNHH